MGRNRISPTRTACRAVVFSDTLFARLVDVDIYQAAGFRRQRLRRKALRLARHQSPLATSSFLRAKMGHRLKQQAIQLDRSIDDVVSAVDVDGVAGDKPGRVMSEKRRCSANVFDTHQAARRSFGLGLFQ
jgi:hypothetical protein